MRFETPVAMPTRSEFVGEFLDAAFPDMQWTSADKRPSTSIYMGCFDEIAKGWGLDCTDRVNAGGIDVESDIFRLLYEINTVSETIFEKSSELIKDEQYKKYEYHLRTFCDKDGGFRNWLNEGPQAISKGVDVSLFFTYLLLSREQSKTTRISFFKKCLGYLGIFDIDIAVEQKLFAFNWEELGGKGRIGELGFSRLKNKSIIMAGAAVLAVVSLIGRYDSSKAESVEKIEAVQKYFCDLFSNEINAGKMFDAAEKAMLDNLKLFFPRSISLSGKHSLHDFYVMPRFSVDGEESNSPVSYVNDAAKSKRVLITAKTGLGKSAYLQMISLCMLKNKYGLSGEEYSGLDRFSELLDVPDDMYVISVPARMFSYCYKSENPRYREWTKDFITLFFNCMWKLSRGLNFYFNQGADQGAEALGTLKQAGSAGDDAADYKVTDDLVNFVGELARKGKLLLVLDSFDEISYGEMRAAYMAALTAFYDKYCEFPEQYDIGAHVVLSTREMSTDTMVQLENALLVNRETGFFKIESLNAEQKKELATKWNIQLKQPDDTLTDILYAIENNHYLDEYSVNPYMLSVICFYFGRDLGEITEKYIRTLVAKMQLSHRTAPTAIQDILQNIDSILQDIATETIAERNSHFSRSKIEARLRKAIDRTGLSDEDVDGYIDKLHDIFVAEVGLIVPADGDDLSYQFINNQIRFELAAKGIQRVLNDNERTSFYREVFFPKVDDVNEFVGLMIPLLCTIEDVKLAGLLVSDLAMRDFADDDEEKILIRAMLDLLLGRYGRNIITAADPGKNFRSIVNRAKRMLLLRVFSSASFHPTDSEKMKIKESAAYRKNKHWLSETLLSLVE